jgi:methionyl-tRNA formyltransferase
MLVEGIVSGRIMAGEGEIVDNEGEVEGLSHAPKITKEDRRVDWRSWDAEKVVRYDQVLGSLWDMSTFRNCNVAKADAQGDKRVTFQGPWERLDTANVEIIYTAGYAILCRIAGVKGVLLGFQTADGGLVSPAAATIEGEQKGKALPGLVQALRNRSKQERG